jgi:hypothetical protein
MLYEAVITNATGTIVARLTTHSLPDLNLFLATWLMPGHTAIIKAGVLV